MSNFFQICWNTPNVMGHSIDPNTGKIDHTEGFGAFDSILKEYSLGNRCIDIGGGKHDYNSHYCLHRYLVDLFVFDPFMRSDEHNKKVLGISKNRPFDSCVSISVLNVINLKEAREDHIKLCRSVTKEYGKVFFKVWPGDGSGIEEIKKDSFQSNRELESYLEEIRSVFGSKNVAIDKLNKIIIATKCDPWP